MLVEMGALGLITLPAPRVISPRAQAIFISLLVGAQSITVVVVIFSLVRARRVIVPSTFALMPMPIGKVPVSPSIKPAAMVVMASPSIILTVRPISIGAIAGRTARQRAALTRSITSAVFRAIGVIGTPAGAV